MPEECSSQILEWPATFPAIYIPAILFQPITFGEAGFPFASICETTVDQTRAEGSVEVQTGTGGAVSNIL